MAQIDIKNCDVYLRDSYAGPGQLGGSVNLAAGYTLGATVMAVKGFVGAVAVGDQFLVAGDSVLHTISAHTELSSGLVNLMAGYMTGAVTMVVDGFAGVVNIGDTFTVVGDTTVHTVTAHTETTGATTSITFTPAIVGTVADDAVITLLTPHTSSITFTPALGAAVVDAALITIQPHSLKIRIGDGNISWTEKRPIVYVKDRGKLDTVRLGDQEPVEVKFDATWIFLTASNTDTAPTIEDVLKKQGLASTWVSSSADPCEPYATNVVVVYTPPCTVTPETYTLHDFRYEDLGQDLKAGHLSITGKCNVVSCLSVRG